jgi:hypothetical protein
VSRRSPSILWFGQVNDAPDESGVVAAVIANSQTVAEPPKRRRRLGD